MLPQKGNRVSYFYDERIGLHASMEAALLKPHIIRSAAASRASESPASCACAPSLKLGTPPPTPPSPTPPPRKPLHITLRLFPPHC